MTLIYKFLKIYDQRQVDESLKDLIYPQISQPAAKLIKKITSIVEDAEKVGKSLN